MFGDSGEGDGGDNWIVNCDTGNWMRNKKVTFMHVGKLRLIRNCLIYYMLECLNFIFYFFNSSLLADTGKYLTANKNTNFNDQNCRGCPIVGKLSSCFDQ